MVGQAESFAQRRLRMVRDQIEGRGIHDPAVLAAMRLTPREQFLAPEYREFAYDDTALPTTAHQTISQPFIVAAMLSALQLQPTDRVLEIGTGSGYSAAVLSHMAACVVTVERHAVLANQARLRLREMGYTNVRVCLGDGTLGWPELAPYNAIVVTAGGPYVPPALKSQLAPGGRLVMPVGARKRQQTLLRLTQDGPDQFREEKLLRVAFVPLIGLEGWRS